MTRMRRMEAGPGAGGEGPGSRRPRGPAKRIVGRRLGSAMVESAIYFPFIVLGIMFTIYVMIDMYSMAALQAHLHLVVRAESGKLSGVTEIARVGDGAGYDRYRAAAFAKRVTLGEGRSGRAKTATASASAGYGAGRMTGTVKIDKSARAYVVREISGVRAVIRK
jgi:hypothetical protein